VANPVSYSLTLNDTRPRQLSTQLASTNSSKTRFATEPGVIVLDDEEEDTDQPVAGQSCGRVDSEGSPSLSKQLQKASTKSQNLCKATDGTETHPFDLDDDPEPSPRGAVREGPSTMWLEKKHGPPSDDSIEEFSDPPVWTKPSIKETELPKTGTVKGRIASIENAQASSKKEVRPQYTTTNLKVSELERQRNAPNGNSIGDREAEEIPRIDFTAPRKRTMKSKVCSTDAKSEILVA
jgi:hypothetical protein